IEASSPPEMAGRARRVPPDAGALFNEGCPGFSVERTPGAASGGDSARRGRRLARRLVEGADRVHAVGELTAVAGGAADEDRLGPATRQARDEPLAPLHRDRAQEADAAEG